MSRPAARAAGWGIPVPDDAAYRRWWASDAERVHVIGKGIVRFHAVYWIAFLNRDLANTLGNLASRALTLSRREEVWRTGPASGVGEKLRTQSAALPAKVDAALHRYDFRAACAVITSLSEAGNRFIDAEEPWHLAKAAAGGDDAAAERFEGVITAVLTVCRVAADELTPFIPEGATRLSAQLGTSTAKPAPAFPRITE